MNKTEKYIEEKAKWFKQFAGNIEHGSTDMVRQIIADTKNACKREIEKLPSEQKYMHRLRESEVFKAINKAEVNRMTKERLEEIKQWVKSSERFGTSITTTTVKELIKHVDQLQDQINSSLLDSK